ncbi:g1.2 [Ichnoviriform fugitivi]|uniref:G1.2 n=1 Tax=Ichnoviriform fugitivi TaxID=265522 RepID=A2Q0P8_9VIRU|nr:g1.2 [Ichnoviriform fugitivi]BAF45763.1 g1.2 [Ichnoviriform fugitivi]
MRRIEEHRLQEQCERDPRVVCVVPHPITLCVFFALSIIGSLFSNKCILSGTIVIQLTVFVFCKLAINSLPEVLLRCSHNGERYEKRHCELIMKAEDRVVELYRPWLQEATESF